jgi:hypothetical protein
MSHSIVVPANAGTQPPVPILTTDGTSIEGNSDVPINNLHGLWVPAFAGTTS